MTEAQDPNGWQCRCCCSHQTVGSGAERSSTSRFGLVNDRGTLGDAWRAIGSDATSNGHWPKGRMSASGIGTESPESASPLNVTEAQASDGSKHSVRRTVIAIGSEGAATEYQSLWTGDQSRSLMERLEGDQFRCRENTSIVSNIACHRPESVMIARSLYRRVT